MDRVRNEEVRSKAGIVRELASGVDQRVLRMVWTREENGRSNVRKIGISGELWWICRRLSATRPFSLSDCPPALVWYIT